MSMIPYGVADIRVGEGCVEARQEQVLLPHSLAGVGETGREAAWAPGGVISAPAHTAPCSPRSTGERHRPSSSLSPARRSPCCVVPSVACTPPPTP